MISTIQMVVGILSAYLIGLAKSGIPGVAMITIPLMADQFGAKASVGLVLPTLITGDICALFFYRKFAKWPLILRVLPLTVVGIVIGWLLLGVVSDTVLKRSMGVLVLALVVLRIVLNHWDISGVKTAHRLGPLVGVLAGITTSMANAAGGLITVYLLWTGVRKEEFIGSAAWFFFVVNCIKVPFFFHRGMITLDTIPLNAAVIPVVVVGALSGVLLVKRINQQVFEVVVQVLIVAASLKLLFGN